MLRIIFCIALLAFTSGCTENIRVKTFGGKQQIKVKPNERLINITWKNANMWVLTEDTVNHISYFRESSAWGVWNGEIIIQ